MAAEASVPRHPVAQPGLFSRGLTAFAQCLKWLVLSLVFSILMEWIGMLWWWPEQGVQHSRQMIRAELSYLAIDFRRSLVSADPVQFAKTGASRAHDFLFHKTGFMAMTEWLKPLPKREAQSLGDGLRRGYAKVSDFVQAGMNITQVFAIRLCILVLATPVFGLFALVGLVDGLVRRDLRRWGGGRESSFVYHYAKSALAPLVLIAGVLYLAMPISLHPTIVILPFATGFGMIVAITASTFKKYL